MDSITSNHGEPEAFLPFTLTQDSHFETAWTTKFDHLGASCARAYIDYVYFQLPVLDASRLYQAWKDNKAPFMPDTVLHHALVVTTIPWLAKDILLGQEHNNREEMLESHLSKFEVSNKVAHHISTTPYLQLS